MAVSEDTIRLILDMGASGKNVEEVTRALAGLESSAKQAAGAIELVDTATDATVASAVEATAAQRALARALDDTDESAKKAGASAKGLGRAGLEAGRALQDFAQGGIGGILNNIEGLTTALGGGPGLAGVMTAVGLAFYFAKPKIDEWIKAMGPMKERIPETTDRIEGMTEALKEDKEAMEELRKQESLGFQDMQKYEELTHRIAQAESDLATARKARAVGPGESKAQRARAGAFREAVQEYGGSERLIENLREAGVDVKRAEELVADALDGANNAIKSIQRTLQGRRGAEITYISPEAAAQQKAIDEFSAQGAKEFEARGAAVGKATDQAQGALDKAAGAIERNMEGFEARLERMGRKSDEIRERSERGEAAQRQVFDMTGGGEFGPEQAQHILQRAQARVLEATRGFAGVISNEVLGMQLQAAVWEEATRQVEQNAMTRMNMGIMGR